MGEGLVFHIDEGEYKLWTNNHRVGVNNVAFVTESDQKRFSFLTCEVISWRERRVDFLQEPFEIVGTIIKVFENGSQSILEKFRSVRQKKRVSIDTKHAAREQER